MILLQRSGNEVARGVFRSWCRLGIQPGATHAGARLGPRSPPQQADMHHIMASIGRR